MLRILIIALLGIALTPNNFCHADTRPNFLVIVSDDQRYDTIDGVMPKTKERIFDSGIQFSKAYITTPACCPSRASILTGQYASRHKVYRNNYKLKGKTLFNFFQKAGYHTGLIGKYLNSWNGRKRPEVDFWASFDGGSSRYDNPILYVNKKKRRYQGYITYLLKDLAIEFLEKSATKNEPFILFFTPNAPHAPTKPDKDHAGLFSSHVFVEYPNYNPLVRPGKPNWVHRVPRFTDKKATNNLFFRERQLETLRAMDESVDEILSALDRLNLSSNTVVIYISDNGIMWGEHSLTSKDCAYEESIKVPLAIRYPRLIPTPVSDTQNLVSNIDIAPTLYELAGITPNYHMDGESLVPVFSGSSVNRKHLLIEGFRKSGRRVPFDALHTGRYVYIENFKDLSELYDLESDPFELHNLIATPDYSSIRLELESSLRGILSDVRQSPLGGSKVKTSKKRRRPI